MKHHIQLSLVPFLLSLPLPLLAAGPLDSSAAPGSTSSYTIGDICDRLDTGAAGNQITFTEPTAIPGPVGCTLNELMGKAPAEDNTAGALISEVLFGKTFWGLRTDGTWGLQTGTAPPAPVIKTGQTTSYATGDDGNLQKGTAWPNPRFTDNSDGTVKDNLTGLIWLKNANCFGQKNWTTALSDANGLSNGSCGLTDGSVAGDWRLPNYKELFSLIDLGYDNPTLSNAAGTAQWTEGDAFSGVQTFDYWSSTTRANPANNAWVVYLSYGGIHYYSKTSSNYVWPVRSEQ